MSEHFQRQLAMLQLVPRAGGRIGTRALCERLNAQGFTVTQRTVQRDLKRFAKLFAALESDGNLDQAGWYWQRDTPVQDLPALDVPMAMTFKLAERFLEPLLPPTVLHQLAPYFNSATRVLDGLDKPGFRSWAERVRILPRAQPLIPAPIGQETIDVLYQALLEGRQFRGRYRRRDGDEAEYDFHPLGLVFRDSVVYLVATVWDYQDPRHYALHRFQHCKLLEQPASAPMDFDLDGYLRTGTFEYADPAAPPIKLAARFTKEAARHLFETPLSADQQIFEDNKGWVMVHATVNDSQQLRWWLCGFCDQVEILEPGSLRNEFAASARALNDLYSTKDL